MNFWKRYFIAWAVMDLIFVLLCITTVFLIAWFYSSVIVDEMPVAGIGPFLLYAQIPLPVFAVPVAILVRG